MLGDIIRINRLANGYTVAYFAKQLGVTCSSVYQWETRKVTPSLGMCVKLARMLGVSLDELAEIKPSPVKNALTQLRVIRPDGSIDKKRIEIINTILEAVQDYRMKGDE